MAAQDHDHRARVPEPLEALIAQLPQLRVAFGAGGADVLGAAEGDLRQAVAARDRGDHAAALSLISSAMQRLATLADRMDRQAGQAMRHVIGQFRTALDRGQAADACEAADVMRKMSGATVVDPDCRDGEEGQDGREEREREPT